MHKSKFIMAGLLNVMVIWSLKAQTSYTDYLWHSPETYAESKVGGFTLYYNSPQDNPEPIAKGIRGIGFGNYKLNSTGKVDWACLAGIRYGQWGIKDSIAFIHSADTLIQKNWSAYLVYGDEKNIDFTYPKIPEFEAYDQEYMTQKVQVYNKEGRLTKSYTDYDTTYYQYNLKGQLLSMEILNPDQQEMGMGGRKVRLFSYNNLGLIENETQIIPLPSMNKSDTLLTQYDYDDEGRLIQKIPASPIFNRPDTTFYKYEKDLLIREETHQNTHVRREPVTHIFETTYRYSEDRLIERKVARNGELETWEQYTYYPNGLIRKKKNLRLDNGEPVEVLTWEYRFTD